MRYVDGLSILNSPAAVDMETGEILINQDIWDKFTDYEKKLILLHEQGHYQQQTDSEEQADKYALKEVAGSCERSLKKAIITLEKIGVPEKRIRTLYEECLKIDYLKNGNKQAKKELDMLQKKQYKAEQFYETVKDTVKDNINYEIVEKDNENYYLPLGIYIGNYYISVEVFLLLLVIVLILKH